MQSVADPRGGGAPPATDQNFLNSIQFLEKSGKFVCWCPPALTGNPGSALAVLSGGSARQIACELINLILSTRTCNFLLFSSFQFLHN